MAQQALKTTANGSLSSLLGELKSLGERGGAALGDLYALAASSFLNRVERLEDLNAERRFRQHSPQTASKRKRRVLSAK